MSKKRSVSRGVAKGESIDKNLSFNFTEKQQNIIASIRCPKTKAVFIDGPSGTSKTLVSIYCGLKEIYENKKKTLLYIRTAAESGMINIGARPGEVSDKIDHLIGPLKDKISELVIPSEIPLLLENKIEAMPVNDIRGSSWNDKYVVIDESQNFEFPELTTVVTRVGSNSKVIFIGDSMQSDIRRSGWIEFMRLFSCEESKENGVSIHYFNEDDIVRSEFVKFAISKIRKRNEKP